MTVWKNTSRFWNTHVNTPRIHAIYHLSSSLWWSVWSKAYHNKGQQRTTKHSLHRRVWRCFLWEFNGPIKKWSVRMSCINMPSQFFLKHTPHAQLLWPQPPGNDVGIGKPSAKHQFPIWHCKYMSRPEVTFANSEVQASQWCWCKIHVFLKLHSH